MFAFAKSVSVFNSLTRLSRVVSVISTFALLFNSSFAGVWSASESLGNAIANWQRGRPGHYTDVPKKPNLGTKPSRTSDRGGMWNEKSLKSAARFKNANEETPLSPGEAYLGPPIFVDGKPRPLYKVR